MHQSFLWFSALSPLVTGLLFLFALWRTLPFMREAFLECLAPVTFPVFSNFLCVWWGHTYNISRVLYNTALAFTPCFLRSLGSASYKSLGLSEVPLGMYIVLHICIFFWIPWHRLGLFKVPSDHLSPHSPTFLL